MTELLALLKTKKALLVGVGNVLKADDGAGVFLTNLIRPTGHIRTLVVEMGIENHIGKINTMAPDITILIDAADMKERPGHIAIIPLEQTGNQTSHTHNIALKNLADHLHMPTMVLGIQPGTLLLGAPLSDSVREACEALACEINETIQTDHAQDSQ
jgi:hydrogenase 3 maturation protease